MNQHTINTFLNAALEEIRTAQAADGSFCSLSFPVDGGKQHAKELHTTFFTSLITEALADCRDNAPAARIREAGARFLLGQRSPVWSFNYWTRESPEHASMPYPDDLDDTFCALAALQRTLPSAINPDVMAAVTKLLIAAEQQPGGPYRTWLTDNPNETWRDVDIAVNANVCYFLRLKGITLQPLQTMLEQSIEQNNFTSRYYPTNPPILYYLARGYRGPHETQLRQAVRQAGKDMTPDDALSLALLASAAQMLGKPSASVEDLIFKLNDAINKTGFLPQPFCYDPAVQGRHYVAGAASLTAAFCIQALTLYQQRQTENERHTSPAVVAATPDTAAIHADIFTFIDKKIQTFPEALRITAARAVQDIRKKDTDNQIALLPCWFFPTKKITSDAGQVLIELGAANIYGWIAYDIYDDIVDGEAGPLPAVSLANALLRELTAIHHEIFRALPDGLNIYQTIMHEMDNENLWEQKNCRIAANGKSVGVPKRLPDFKQYERLAAKSLGHCIGPVAALLLYGTPEQRVRLPELRSALRDFLIARQLHDDAHDWLDDLRQGRLTAANTPLLARHHATRTVRLGTHTPAVQREYWEYIIPRLSESITQRVRSAKAALRVIKLPYEQWIDQRLLEPLELGAATTQRQSTDTIAFLDAYKKI